MYKRRYSQDELDMDIGLDPDGDPFYAIDQLVEEATSAVTFFVPGVVGKARPRVTKRGITYTPKKTKDYEALTAAKFREAAPFHKPEDGPVIMRLEIRHAIPKSWSKLRKRAVVESGAQPMRKPDMDNIVKIISDALNEVAYLDDKQVVAMQTVKVYTPEQSGEGVVVTLIF